MPHPAFFELSRVVGTPLYINAHRVTSVDFIGTDEEGYVAFIAMDTLTKEQSHYAWGEARALEAMFSKHTFGSHVRFDNCCKPRNSFTKHTIRQQGWGAFR